MDPIQVFHGNELTPGSSTMGIKRNKAFESDQLLFGRTLIEPSAKSGWHHHGKRDLYGFLLTGRLTFDCKDFPSVELIAGDFFRVPGGLVHRDVNPDPDKEAIVVNIIVGDGPPVINFD
jgi:quercetin dioxygenase-like cupin family protein